MERGRLLIRMSHKHFCKATVKKKYPQLIMLFYDTNENSCDEMNTNAEGHDIHQTETPNDRLPEASNRHAIIPQRLPNSKREKEHFNYNENPIVLLFDDPRSFIKAFEEIALKS